MRDLPEQIMVDELIERIIVLAKIDDALEKAKLGDVFAHKNVMEEAKSWLKK